MNKIIKLRRLLCSHHVYEYKIMQFYDKGGILSMGCSSLQQISLPSLQQISSVMFSV